MALTWQEIARRTHDASEAEEVSFHDAVKALMQAGFDGYAVDFRRTVRTYFMPDGESIELAAQPTAAPVAARFDGAKIKDAVREAQSMAPGYTYHGFCAKAASAGCAGYIVSISGQRVLYYGRTGETHTEFFPGAQSEAVTGSTQR